MGFAKLGIGFTAFTRYLVLNNFLRLRLIQLFAKLKSLVSALSVALCRLTIRLRNLRLCFNGLKIQLQNLRCVSLFFHVPGSDNIQANTADADRVYLKEKHCK